MFGVKMYAEKVIRFGAAGATIGPLSSHRLSHTVDYLAYPRDQTPSPHDGPIALWSAKLLHQGRLSVHRVMKLGGWEAGIFSLDDLRLDRYWVMKLGRLVG